MSFWFALLMWVATTIIGELLRPKPKFDTPQPSSLGDFQLPTAQEGRAIPVVWGTCKVSGPNVLWYGGLIVTPITKKVKSGFFSKTTVTTGYHYHMTIHVAICHGSLGVSGHDGVLTAGNFQVLFDDRLPAQTLSEIGSVANATIRGFGQTATIGTRPEKYRIFVNAEGLFGGDTKEGGIVGEMDIYPGGLWHSANDSLQVLLGTNIPAYRGISTAMLGAMYLGTSSYIKPVGFIVTRCPSPKLFLNGDQTRDINAQIGVDANPAYIALEIITDTVWGLGVPQALIDLDSFYAVAATLKSEGLGMSYMLDNPAEAQGVIADVMRHIDGVIYTDPATGLITLKLARKDYDAGTLPVFDQSNLAVCDMTRGSWSETKNVVKILYIDGRTVQPDSNVLLQSNLYDNSAADESMWNMTPAVGANVTITGERARFNGTGAGDAAEIEYTGGDLVGHNTESYTLEYFLELPDGGNGNSDIRTSLIDGNDTDVRHFAIMHTGSGNYRKMYERETFSTHWLSSAQWTANLQFHFAVVYRASDNNVRAYFNGVKVADVAAVGAHLPGASGKVTFGASTSPAMTYYITGLRLKLGEEYIGDSFTPPVYPLSDPVIIVGEAPFIERAVQQQNLANIQARGGELATEIIKFHGLSNAANANKVAARVLKTLSYPLAAVKITANRDAWQLRPGSVFKLDWPALGITGMVCRATKIAYGELLNNRIEIDAVEDIFGLAATAFTAPPATSWVDEIADPQPAAAERLVEVPYHFIAAADRYIATLAVRASVLDLGYEVWSDRDGDSNADLLLTSTIDQFVPSGLLTAAYPKCTAALDATGFAVSGGRDLDRLESITAGQRGQGTNLLLIDDEIMAWQTVAGNSGGTAATITNVVRGVLDTVPAAHSSGARVWFVTDGAGIADEQLYPDDVEVWAKLLPFNGRGTLPIANAALLDIMLASRALRPYPPGNTKVNGESCPTFFGTDVILTWSHRHRVTQTTDQVIVHQDAGDYVAQPEGDYVVDIIIDGGVVQTYTDFALSSDGYRVEYTMAQRALDHSDLELPVTFRIAPVNDDLLTGTVRDLTFVMSINEDEGEMMMEARLTLQSVTPVPTSDQTAKTTIYLTPYRGNRIRLYSGTAWATYALTEKSIAVPATTNTMYDLFLYDNASVLTLEAVAWTNDTTRATALVLQDGVLVKSGSTTKRYVGSFRTAAVSGQTEDSEARRLLWNYYNRVVRKLKKTDITNSWNWSTASYHQANASTANQVDAVVGVAEEPIALRAESMVLNSSSTWRAAQTGIGVDSTSVNSAQINVSGQCVNVVYATPHAEYAEIPVAGYHYYAWLEYGAGADVQTWTGDTATGFTPQTGLIGSVAG